MQYIVVYSEGSGQRNVSDIRIVDNVVPDEHNCVLINGKEYAIVYQNDNTVKVKAFYDGLVKIVNLNEVTYG